MHHASAYHPAMKRSVALLAVLLLAACASSSGGRSTADSRVRSFKGTVPPELPQTSWMRSDVSSLAQLRGQVVYLQFAFPT